MQLSKRLQAVADLVTPGCRLVDVGTDHGYIPIYLILNKKAQTALAMDVNRGPLLRAEENIHSYELEQYITTRLSDGLAALQKGEGDTLVIAGMGGVLMQRILSDGLKSGVLEGFRELILEPQSEIPEFRSWLYRESFHIEKELLILEDGKYYPVWRVVPGQEAMPEEVELYFGKELLDRKDPVLRKFLEKEQEKLKQIAAHVEQKGSEKAAGRLLEIEKELRLIAAALERYESK